MPSVGHPCGTHPGDPELWGCPTPGTGTTPGLALAGLERGWLLSPCFHHPWLGACPWHRGGLGVQHRGGRSSGASPTIAFYHRWDVTGDLQPAHDRGLSPAGAYCPPHTAASRGVRPLRPCLALAHVRWALGTIPRAGQQRPCRGARGGAEGYFTGYFTRWHQLFLPSAPNHVPPPRAHHPASCLPSPPASPSTGHRCGCATFPLCPPPFSPCPGTYCSASIPVQEPPALVSYY